MIIMMMIKIYVVLTPYKKMFSMLRRYCAQFLTFVQNYVNLFVFAASGSHRVSWVEKGPIYF